MAKETAKDVLSGTDVKLFFEGEEIGTWQSLEATITINYEDVQIGYDVKRKAVSWQGDGNLSLQATNSMPVKLFNKLKNNKDAEFTIEAEITKTKTGETQFETLNEVTFDSLPISAWNKGELVSNELAFRFSPSSMVVTQLID